MEGDGLMWLEKTVFIVGGGPSVANLDLSLLEGKHVLAVNNAHEIVPQYDVLYFTDSRWWGWYRDRIAPSFSGPICTLADPADITPKDPRMVFYTRYYPFTDMGHPLSDQMGQLAGHESGYSAIDLAVQHGASRLILIGYDFDFMGGRSHWHSGHPAQSEPERYRRQWPPFYAPLARELRRRRVQAFLVGPSRLEDFKRMKLEEACQSS